MALNKLNKLDKVDDLQKRIHTPYQSENLSVEKVHVANEIIPIVNVDRLTIH